MWPELGCSLRPYGSFPLPDWDSDSDSDSKPHGYIVPRRTCSLWLRFRFWSLSHSICIVQKSVSESESEFGNGNKPLLWRNWCSLDVSRKKYCEWISGIVLWILDKEGLLVKNRVLTLTHFATWKGIDNALAFFSRSPMILGLLCPDFEHLNFGDLIDYLFSDWEKKLLIIHHAFCCKYRRRSLV